ncbi:MAG: hypothetical protein KKD74_10765 [Bacteroidetes bacterium]|nr:hypothetical protein [Bacteroidota bacterium]
MPEHLLPLDPDHLTLPDFIDRETLHERLKLFVMDLLADHFEQLCALMYRHDVNEHDFHLALDLPSEEQQAGRIAELVIERELKKMESRAAYARSRPKKLEQ